jgi:CheY-like chemotaxis protein
VNLRLAKHNVPSAFAESGVSRSILHVEDEEAFSVIAEIVLEDLNEAIAMHHARNVGEAYRFLFRVGEYKRAVKPDLILLGLNLRPNRGYEVLEIVRGAMALKDIPVVVFSSADSPVDRRQSLLLGALAVFAKPSTYEDYASVLRKIVTLIPKKANT